MADLTEGEILFIDRETTKGTSKTTIASMLHCSPSTVYNQLEHLRPRDGTFGKIHQRKRQKGSYKCNATDLYEIKQYVLAHRFCTNLDIQRDCKLKAKSMQTICNWLKKLGIGSFTAATNQFLKPGNKEKRYNEIVKFQF